MSVIHLKSTALMNEKNGAFGNTSTTPLKKTSDVCTPPLSNICKIEIITQKSFLNNLTVVDVTPVLKKDDASLLKNYKPIRFLPVVSKIYEKLCRSRF